MFRRQLIIQEGIMAMPLHRLLGRALTINLVGAAVALGTCLVGTVIIQEIKKDYEMDAELKEMSKK